MTIFDSYLIERFLTRFVSSSVSKGNFLKCTDLILYGQKDFSQIEIVNIASSGFSFVLIFFVWYTTLHVMKSLVIISFSFLVTSSVSEAYLIFNEIVNSVAYPLSASWAPATKANLPSTKSSCSAFDSFSARLHLH